MASLIVMVRDLADRLQVDSQDVVNGVADDHTTTTLTDSRDALYSSGDPNAYDRRHIYLEAIKDQSRITEGGFAGGTGVFTLSPAITDAPAVVTGDASNVTTDSTSLTDSDESMTTDEWIGYTVVAGGQLLDVTSNTATKLVGTAGWSEGGSGPGAVAWTVGTRYIITERRVRVLKNAINAIQKSVFLETFYPLSMHVMGNDANDMEPSTIATDYSATNATLAKESTIVFNGAQSLKITATSASGYANTGNIGVKDGQGLYAAMMMYVTSGDSGTFRVVDVTNTATIEDATTDEPSWTELVYPFSVPTDCEQIDFRFIADANTDVIYAEDFQVWSSGRRVYSLPSWITRPEQLLDVRAFAQGTGGPSADNDYRANETRSQPLSYGFENVDRRGNLPLHIWVDATAARPFIYALRPLDELSTDTSNSVAEQDFIVRWAEKLVREPDKASETMALLRAIHFQRVTTELPNRIGVSM